MQSSDILPSLKLNQANQSCPQIGYIHEKLIKALKRLPSEERELNEDSLFSQFSKAIKAYHSSRKKA